MPTPSKNQAEPTSRRFQPPAFAATALLSLVVFGALHVETHAQPATVEKTERSAPTLRPGDNGSAVEDMQRRLNRELTPSPRLDIDGDYGDGTRAAVLRFQRTRGLEPTGIADSATRAALGTKPIIIPEAPKPEVVNAEKPVKQPAEPLDGPPFVSAKAWAIADGRTGEILWGSRQNEPLPMASTTKMMTALIVGRIAEKDPKALEEIITFSKRADQTGGSTSGVRAGEKVSVRELLYGLMLPSGNDASVAFGEHFGARLKAAGNSSDDADPLPHFIAEMNRLAAELGMRESHFANTHGLPAEEHHASAADLAKLGLLVVKHPVLAPVVSTSRHGCTLVGEDGSKRNVVWSNTNNLLGTEGYDGVKTGTTNAAGACLVASGHRGDDHLIVVILGAVTSDSRYLDARNLFRWGWIRRGHTPAKDAAASTLSKP